MPGYNDKSSWDDNDEDWVEVDWYQKENGRWSTWKKKSEISASSGQKQVVSPAQSASTTAGSSSGSPDLNRANDDNWHPQRGDGNRRSDWDRREHYDKDKKPMIEFTTDVDLDAEVEVCDEEVRMLRGKEKMPAGEIPRWTRWEDCYDPNGEDPKKLPEDLIRLLSDGAKFERPTTIQSVVWPILMRKEDLIGVAQTGSGKTLAFLLPLFVQVKQQMFDEGGDKIGRAEPWVVVLAPTRELSKQIYDETKRFGDPAGIRSAVAYGGDKNRREQLYELNKRAHILVGCPGRINDMKEKRELHVEKVFSVVLDEADRMLDMGFEWQIQDVIASIPESRQSLLFSATFPPGVAAMSNCFLFDDAIHVAIGSTDSLTGNKNIEQRVEFPDNVREKDDKICQLIYEEFEKKKANPNHEYKFLIFCKSKNSCNALTEKFNGWHCEASCIHGDLDQWTREKALADFRAGVARVLFATDVASRGLDIKGVSHVILYDPADDVETHTHRIGRTGRAGKTGVAISYLLPGDLWAAQFIVMTMKKAEQEPSPELLQAARECSHYVRMFALDFWGFARGFCYLSRR
ncbi:unnamed protein product [Amoebophrya sp. A25]|nr:unnamed protein product [Amoebophrya sp. A25]|eukprot:GSA25T00010106001.1